MQAALLAQRGVTGPAEVIDGHKGFMDSVSGPFSIDWARAPLDCVERTVVRRYSADVHSQTAIEAALELQRTHGFTAADIAWVEVEVFDVAHRLIGGGEAGDKTLVFSKEDATHSMPYLIAVAFLDGAVTPAQFARTRLQRADVQQLLCRVTVRPRGDFSERFPGSMPSRVAVSLSDGRALGLSLPDYPGFHTRAPSWDDAVAKFTTLLSPRFRERPRLELVNVVRELDQVTTAELMQAIAGMTASPRAALQAS
jgi:2-methylcitrate dehydratase